MPHPVYLLGLVIEFADWKGFINDIVILVYMFIIYYICYLNISDVLLK
jgi:hypothetical protein